MALSRARPNLSLAALSPVSSHHQHCPTIWPVTADVRRISHPFPIPPPPADLPDTKPYGIWWSVYGPGCHCRYQTNIPPPPARPSPTSRLTWYEAIGYMMVSMAPVTADIRRTPPSWEEKNQIIFFDMFVFYVFLCDPWVLWKNILCIMFTFVFSIIWIDNY